MKFRTFATALLAGVFLASPVLAADQHFLADRHVAKGVKCESCHNPGAPSSKNVTRDISPRSSSAISAMSFP